MQLAPEYRRKEATAELNLVAVQWRAVEMPAPESERGGGGGGHVIVAARGWRCVGGPEPYLRQVHRKYHTRSALIRLCCQNVHSRQRCAEVQPARGECGREGPQGRDVGPHRLFLQAELVEGGEGVLLEVLPRNAFETAEEVQVLRGCQLVPQFVLAEPKSAGGVKHAESTRVPQRPPHHISSASARVAGGGAHAAGKCP